MNCKQCDTSTPNIQNYQMISTEIQEKMKHFVIDIESLINVNSGYAHAGIQTLYPFVKECHAFCWVGYMHLKHIHLWVRYENKQNECFMYARYNGIVSM